MKELAAWATAAPRQHARLLGAFAALALLLTVVGIYGVLAYAVSRRTREFGIRLALGADRRQLILAVIRRSVVLSVIGVCVGSVGAIALTGALRAFLFEVTPTDPATFAGVVLLVVASAVLAGLIPARRAAHVDPCTSLRAE